MKQRLMISGSRYWKDASRVKRYIHLALNRAKELEMDIVCGDAPGVDEWVWQTAAKLDYGHALCVAGVADLPRNQWAGCYQSGFATYTERDRRLVDRADIVLCLWNGKSCGTKAVHNYAVSLHKQSHLVKLEDAE